MYLTRDPDRLALAHDVCDRALPEAERLLARLRLADWYEDAGLAWAADLLRQSGSVSPSGATTLGWWVERFRPDPEGELYTTDGRFTHEFVGVVDLLEDTP
jgi:hypothetical protein